MNQSSKKFETERQYVESKMELPQANMNIME